MVLVRLEAGLLPLIIHCAGLAANLCGPLLSWSLVAIWDGRSRRLSVEANLETPPARPLALRVHPPRVVRGDGDVVAVGRPPRLTLRTRDRIRQETAPALTLLGSVRNHG